MQDRDAAIFLIAIHAAAPVMTLLLHGRILPIRLAVVAAYLLAGAGLMWLYLSDGSFAGEPSIVLVPAALIAAGVLSIFTGWKWVIWGLFALQCAVAALLVWFLLYVRMSMF